MAELDDGSNGAVPPTPAQEVSETPPEIRGAEIEVLKPQDKVRRDLAVFLLWILVGVLALNGALIFLTPALGLDAERVASEVQLTFTAVITLAGTVFGFYFASDKK